VKVYKHLILGATALGTSLALPVSVIAEQIQPLEEVVVVGSRAAPRSVADSPVPVDVFGADDLARAASLGGEMSQLLHSLVPSFNFPRQSNSDTADLVRPAQLRGLSPDHTLVLVNGKRRHTTAILNTGGSIGKGSAPVDLNAIPMSAIKRVEVLRDGAAAQYGSDAIAGVINIVLKDSSEGGQVSMTYGEYNTDFAPTNKKLTDGETVLISGNAGIELDDGFINVSGQYRDRNSTNRAGFDSWSPGQQVTHRAGDPEEEGYSLFANWGKSIAGDKELYGYIGSSEREATGVNFLRYDYESDAVVSSIYPNGFLPVNVGVATDQSFVIGITGGSDWAWDISLNYGASQFELDVENSNNASMGAASPTEFDIGEYDYSQLLLNADVVKSFTLSDTPVSLALGIQYRQEDFESHAGSPASYIDGGVPSTDVGSQGIVGLSPADEADEDRDAYSVYADAEFELSERFIVGTAARYEDYSDFGDTFNSKLTARYELTDNLALRGAASTGFRAPSLIQNSYKSSRSDFSAGPGLTTVALVPVDDALARAAGSKDLEAEKSKNFSVGLSGDWDNGVSLTVDFYRVDIKDRITLSDRVAVADPSIDEIEFFTNSTDTRTDGVDVVIGYGWNEFDFTLAYNESDTDITNNGTSNLEVINSMTSANPESKWIFTTNWQRNGWSTMARVTRYGETQRNFDFGWAQPEQTYSGNTTVDIDVEYDFSNGLRVSLGANNLFDEYPEESSSDINYGGNLPYDVIPPVGMGGRYIYARTTYNF
jgi:iron complex outermembrane receptor protein